jgi:hypothetical protein
MTPGPIFRRKVLAGIAGGFLLAAAAFWVWIESAAARRWADLEKVLDGLDAEIESQPRERPVFAGDPVEGEAWEFYTKAIEELAPFPEKDLSAYLERSPQADRSHVKEIVRSREAALARLCEGARRTRAKCPFYEWSLDRSIPNEAPFIRAVRLASLARCGSRLLREEGRSVEAADLLLDMGRFGGDVSRGGGEIAFIMGLAILRSMLEEVRDWIGSGTPDPFAVHRLSMGLETLDRDFPSFHDSVKRDLLSYGRLVESGGYSEAVESLCRARSVEPPGAWTYRVWRYGFSRRLMEADAVACEVSWFRRSAAAEQGSWALEREIVARNVAAAEALVARTGNGVLWRGWGGNRARREVRAQLRLIRTAFQDPATGEAVLLDDPFGGKIRTARTGSARLIWSAGKDGIDDGGTGEWRPVGRDIVLELRR